MLNGEEKEHTASQPLDNALGLGQIHKIWGRGGRRSRGRRKPTDAVTERHGRT